MSAGTLTPGRRIDPCDLDAAIGFAPGDYGHSDGVRWIGCTPDGRIADLSNHHVTEHDDGTISVGLSILTSGGGIPGSWHGHLERGVWRECQ